MTWKAPDAGAYLSSALPIPLKLNVTGTSMPATVSYTTSGCAGGSGTVSGPGPDYTGTFGGGDCVWTLTASLNTAFAPLTFTIDRTPPTVTITVPSPPARLTYQLDPFIGNAWRRDESVVVKVVTNEPTQSPPSLQVSGPLRDGGYSAFSPTGVALQLPIACCGATQNCNCYAVNAATPPFDAFDGALKLSASAIDRGGLIGTSQSNGLVVTRWRWGLSLFASSDVPRSPALDDTGNVIVGAASTLTTGNLYRVNPASGVLWQSTDLGALSAAPVIGASGGNGVPVFVPVSTAAGPEIKNVLLGSGGTVDGGCPAEGTAISGSVALGLVYINSALAESVIHALKHSSGVAFGLHRPADIVNPCVRQSLLANTRNVLPESGLSVDGNVFYAPNVANNTIERRDASNQSLAASATVGVNARTLPYVSSALRVFGSGNVAAGTSGSVFAVNTSNHLLAWTFPGGGPSIGTVGSVAVGAGNLVYFGSSNPPLLNVLQADGTGRLSSSSVGNITATPAIGTGNIVYVVTGAGVVQAFDSNLSPLWQSGNIINEVFDTSPVLDCARDASGAVKAGPGTLYAVSSGAGELYSIIVDSKGLDLSAPWPKFQHDTRNTGSVGAALTASGVCP